MKSSTKKAMFTMSPLGWFVAAALFLAPMAATAGDKEKAPGSKPGSVATLMKMKPMDLMHAVDADKEGYVTKEEFLKFMEEVYNRMDRKKDGKVDSKEWVDPVWVGP